MEYQSSNRYYVKGEVEVREHLHGRKSKIFIYDAVGVTNGLNIRKALKNMRLNAEYKHRYIHEIKSGVTLYTKIRTYQVFKKINENIKTKRITRKNKYYYAHRDKRTGEIIKFGKWESKEIDVDTIVSEDDDF